MNLNIESLKLLYYLKETHPHTYSHSINVSKISVEFGRKLNLSRKDLETLEFASLFHDIGKLKIPEDILRKPGKLTDEEYEKIKNHPIYSVKLLKQAGITDTDILQAVLFHHEKLDGTGYPKGLIGRHIPYLARIISVTDSFEAMMSDRCYKKAYTLDKAVQELTKWKGVQFDSDIVTEFVKLIEVKEKIKER